MGIIDTLKKLGIIKVGGDSYSGNLKDRSGSFNTNDSFNVKQPQPPKQTEEDKPSSPPVSDK